MKRRIIMIVVICILLIFVFFLNRKNEVILQEAQNEKEPPSPISVIENTTTTLKSNNGKFDRVNQMLERIEYRYKILKLQDTADFNIDSEIESIKKEIESKGSLIQNNEDTYNKIVLNLEDINSSIESVFYSLGIEFIEDDFQKIQLTLENIDGNTFTCTDDLIIYTMDVSSIENKDDFAVGDKLNIFYSSITYENNIGKISTFYIEKLWFLPLLKFFIFHIVSVSKKYLDKC